MDEMLKAALTAAMVLMVMGVARLGRGRLAGVVAALPTVTAPTLAWLAHDRGIAYAVDAAIGSVAACAMLAAFAAAYALAARRWRGAVSLACGIGAAALLAGPSMTASARLNDALALAFGVTLLAGLCIPAGREAATRRRAAPQAAPPATALATPMGIAFGASGLSALAATLGPLLGTFATGLLSSLPVISGAAAMAEHARGGHAAAADFLRGYVRGLFGKAAFGAVYALLAAPVGTPAAIALGCACAVLMSLAGARTRPALIAAPAPTQRLD
jgi:hypothetical protein